MARMTGRQFDKQMRRKAAYAKAHRRRGSVQVAAPAAPPVLDAARLAEIAELAAAVAQGHCPRGRVEPAAILRACGITMSSGHYAAAFDGMLEHAAGRFHVYANLDRLRSIDSPRARFTLAHELGHYYIDEHREALAAGRTPAHRSCCEYESANLAEQEADRFGASLLMPMERFAPQARRLPPGLAGITLLAGEFGVSLTAAALRYAEADVRPCAVIKWDAQRYAWKKLSSSTFQARYRATVEAPAALSADCPTRLALAGQAPPTCGFFQAGTTAAAWFARVEDEGQRNVILMEEAVVLGRFGVLTFLYPAVGERARLSPFLKPARAPEE
jgi:hypothetical protein